MSLGNTNAARSCFQLMFDGNNREKISSMDWPISFPTPFLSIQFWNLTFASLPAFQTYRGAEKCLKFICPLQGNNGHPSAEVWMYLEMSHHVLPERARNHKAQICSNVSVSHFIGFYSPEKQASLFPGKNSAIYSLHKGYFFIKGNHLFTTVIHNCHVYYFGFTDQRDIYNSPF